MQDTNLEITATELKLMQDTTFFEKKWSILQKIESLLSGLQDGLAEKKNYYGAFLPEKVLQTPGKISRGENYLGYPYLVLDFPRIFEKEHVFAYRSMFWWGNNFGFSLHIGGRYFEDAFEKFLVNYASLQLPGIYLCVNEDPWEYHYKKDNYELLSDFADRSMIEHKILPLQFIKLSLRTDIADWAIVKKDGLRAFDLFTSALYL